MHTLALPFRSQTPAWRLAQLVVLVGTLVVAAAALAAPTFVLPIFWGVVVPLLPLSFLITPIAWRSLCPLATFNVLANSSPAPRSMTGELSAFAGTPAILALLVLVPARRFAFNTSGVALVGLVVVAAVVAIVLGRQYEARAGFCNWVCPVLPVERLYGQNALVDMGNPRCVSCTVCTPRGCLDLAGNKALAQHLGPTRRDRSWLLTAFGVFATSFPGFIVGYFTTADGSWHTAASLYGHTLLYALGSFLIANAVIRLTRMESEVALAILGGLSAALYYWFATPAFLKAVGVALPSTLVLAVPRVAIFLFIVWWTLRAARRPHASARDRELPVLA
jgi:hypothetical protein